MAQKLTLNDARESLNAHVTAKGTEIREKYGPIIGWAQLQLILQDRDIVRYPCDLAFEAEPLEPGECAYAHPKGERPEEGFTIYIHPYFLTDPSRVPALALYQLVVVNYGTFASPADAEAFGASVLGLPVDSYYESLCSMADEILPPEEHSGEIDESPCGCGSHAHHADSPCSCGNQQGMHGCGQ